MGRKSRMRAMQGRVRLVNTEDRATSSEPLICTAKEHVSNPQLSECTRTHNAWFHSDVEIGTFEYVCIIRFEDLIYCTQFCMTDALLSATHFLHCRKHSSEYQCQAVQLGSPNGDFCDGRLLGERLRGDTERVLLV